MTEVEATRKELLRLIDRRKKAIAEYPEYDREREALTRLDACLMFPPNIFAPEPIVGEESNDEGEPTSFSFTV